MKIGLFEYICGSGTIQPSPHTDDPSGWNALLLEGNAMLQAIGADLIAEGFEVHTAVESEIVRWAGGLPGAHVHAIPFLADRNADEVARLWAEIAAHCDRSIVIAPELDGILGYIVRRLRLSGVQVLASDALFLDVASDQWRTCRAWREHGLETPDTQLLSHTDAWIDSSAGWVVKRRDSAGGVGMRRFDERDAKDRFRSELLASGESLDRWVVQPWIEGNAASMAILAGKELCPVGALWQYFAIEKHTEFETRSYHGGRGPVEGATKERMDRFARDVLGAVPGLPSGWIGIDFVVAPNGTWIPIEVNPRLTTSYLGYRKGFGSQLAAAWVSGDQPHRENPEFTDIFFSLDHFQR